jgi:hypothetical protein
VLAATMVGLLVAPRKRARDYGDRLYGGFDASAAYMMPRGGSRNPDYDLVAIQLRPNQLETLGDVGGRGLGAQQVALRQSPDLPGSPP